MSNKSLGYLYVLLSAAAFASMSLLTKWAYAAGLSPWSFTLVTSVLSLPILALIRRRSGAVVNWDRPVGLPLILTFAACGAGAGIAFNVALASLSISLGTLLLFTYPAFTALAAWLLLGQRPSGPEVGALGLTLAGAVLTANLHEAIAEAASLVGISLALVAAVAHGMYIALGERLSTALSATGATAATKLVGALGVLLIHPAVVREVAAIPWQGWLLAFLATAVAGVVPFLFLNRGIALIGANQAAIVSVAELPFALGLGILFQGDQILPAQWAGAILITAAVILSQRQFNASSSA